jgi:hypothetical protein
MAVKYDFNQEIIDRAIFLYEEGYTIAKLAEIICEENAFSYHDSIRRKFSKIIAASNTVSSVTKTTQYTQEVSMSAIKRDGSIMSIEEYCNAYGIPFEQARTYKLVTHTGTPYYNIASNVLEQQSYVNEQELKDLIEDGLKEIKLTLKTNATGSNKVGVVKIADLHLGAYVDNLIRTKNFSIDILANKLFDSATEINARGYKLVHVHILGDLIESFTGLSHKNTWKGLDKAMVGAEAVKLVVKILHENFLSRINNLGEVKVVAGNHDRVTSDNKEDVQGGAANLVCWGLELIGYNVEFNSLVITHVVDKVCHILTHGHHMISKKSTKQLCWDYGVQGMYNLICEGHLHSIIQKLNINQRDSFQTIKDDAVDHRRINCPSFFTGNFFSESLGYTSESGFIITEDNGKGVPNVFYYAI